MMSFIQLSILLSLMLFIQPVSGDELASLRTSKQIVTVDQISAPYFTVQVAALQMPAGDPGFFQHLDVVREFISDDGFTRYTVGQFNTFAQAAQELPRLLEMGYTGAFVLDTRKIRLKSGVAHQVPSQNDFVPRPGVIYTIQLAAFRFPVFLSHFEGLDNVKEFYLPDQVYRYTIGSFQGSDALAELERIRQNGFPDAFLVPLDKYLSYQIE